jgi:hypothetical protein
MPALPVISATIDGEGVVVDAVPCWPNLADPATKDQRRPFDAKHSTYPRRWTPVGSNRHVEGDWRVGFRPQPESVVSRARAGRTQV